MAGFWNFLKGISLIPNSSDENTSKGDLNVKSSDGKLYYHDGASSSAEVTEKHAAQGASRLENKDHDAASTNIVDGTDTTKKLGINLSGAVTSTKTTLISSQTVNRSITLFDADDTVVGRNTTDTLTNKTINANNNTISNLTNSNLNGSAGITNANLASMPTQTFKGRTTAGTGAPEDLTATQATAILNVFGPDLGSGGVKGLVPATLPGDGTKFLMGDGTWVALAGGPAQAQLQFKDEGSNLGSTGTATALNFTGSLVTASRTLNEITVDVSVPTSKLSEFDLIVGSAAQVIAGTVDYSSLQDAIDALSSGGTILLLSSYATSEDILIDNDDIVIRGQGNKSVINGLVGFDAEHCKLTDVRITDDVTFNISNGNYNSLEDFIIPVGVVITDDGTSNLVLGLQEE